MINFFNRRELITVTSVRRLMQVRQALYAAEIPCYTRPMGRAFFAYDREKDMPTCHPDKNYSYVIYVRREDYKRALEAFKSAVQNY